MRAQSSCSFDSNIYLTQYHGHIHHGKYTNTHKPEGDEERGEAGAQLAKMRWQEHVSLRFDSQSVVRARSYARNLYAFNIDVM